MRIRYAVALARRPLLRGGSCKTSGEEAHSQVGSVTRDVSLSAGTWTGLARVGGVTTLDLAAP